MYWILWISAQCLSSAWLQMCSSAQWWVICFECWVLSREVYLPSVSLPASSTWLATCSGLTASAAFSAPVHSSLGQRPHTGQEKKKRKHYTFRRQFNEKPSYIPGCPGTCQTAYSFASTIAGLALDTWATYKLVWSGIMVCLRTCFQSCMLASLYGALEICHDEIYKHVLHHCMQEVYAQMPTDDGLW